MKKVRALKFALGIFFVVQIIFSQFWEQIFRNQNLYPLYTWQIFHTEPTLHMDQAIAMIKSIDGRVITPPTSVMKLKHEFSTLNFYSLSRKLSDASEWIDNSDNRDLANHVSELFLIGHRRVQWDLKKVTFDPIEYYESEKVEAERVLGEFDAQK